MPFVSLKTKFETVLNVANTLRNASESYQASLADPVPARRLVDIARTMRWAIDAGAPYENDAALSAYGDEQFAGQAGWVPLSLQIAGVKLLAGQVLSEVATRLTSLGCLANGKLTLETYDVSGVSADILLPPEQVATVRSKLVNLVNAIPN